MDRFYIIGLLLTIQIFKTQSTACKDRVSMKRKLSLKSSSNNTGHWTAHVTMHNDLPISNNNIKAKSYPWNVDMSFDRERCNGAEFQTIEALFTIPPLLPGPDYEFYANIGYYKFHPELKTWKEAGDVCVSEGAHLAILNSDTESNLFKQMFARYSGEEYALIGFHDLYDEGQYFTIFGEPLQSTGFTEFTRGQPDNHKYGGDETHPGEDCGSIYRDGKLNDLLCTRIAPFICEQEI